MFFSFKDLRETGLIEMHWRWDLDLDKDSEMLQQHGP